MSKPRCNKHKRSLPYCDACKAAVREAEEQVAREEQAKALESEVGFPKTDEPDPGGTPEGHGPGDEHAGEEVVQDEGDGPIPVGGTFPAGDGPEGGKETDKAWADREDVLNPPDRLDDPWADGKTPAEGDEVGDWLPPCQREGFSGCEDCRGECQGHPDPDAAEFVTVQVTREAKRLIETIEHAISNGQEVTVIMGDADTRLRQEGRKEVVTMVRDYFADSIDTGAFKLLEYLEKQCR